MRRKIWILISVLVVSALGLASCAPAATPTPAAVPSGRITLYTSVPQPIADKIQADFQSKFPEITLDVFRAGTSEVVTKLMTEKEAGAIMADLVWVAEPSTYEDFKDQDMLLQVTPAEAAALPAEMKDPEGYYYAGRLLNMVIGYNTGLADPPKTWQEFASSEYAPKSGFPSPIRSGAAEGAVKTLADAYGWQYFDDYKANGGVQIQNNSTLRDMLATGEIMCGAALDYMMRAAKAAGSPIDYLWPEDGAVFIPSPVAVLKASQNPEAAKVFLDYVLSQEGQQTMVELGNFIPVRTDVDPPGDAPGLGKINKLSTDWAGVAKLRDDTKNRWTAMFGE